MSFPHAAGRLLTGAGIVTTTVVALALPAAAHVTVNPKIAEPGGYATFDVKVPNEEADADTTKVQLFLPTDHPIASVSVQPVPGWTVEPVKSRLPKPIKVEVRQATFFNQSAFNNVRPILANAFIVSGIPYRWKRGVREPLPKLPK